MPGKSDRVANALKAPRGGGAVAAREDARNVRLTALAAELVTEREARAREAVDVEQSRIARELHDAVAHTVSVMTI